MQSANVISKRVILVAILSLLLAFSSSVARAESPDDRDGFSGRQLFEHEWQWTGPAPQPSREQIAGRFSLTRSAGLLTLRDARDTQSRRAEIPVTDVLLGDGLGPLHNGTSCVECHVAGGGSGVQHNVTLLTIDPRSEAVMHRTGDGKELFEVFPGVIGSGGALIFNTVVHDQSTRGGYQEIRGGLAEFVPGGIDDSWFDPKQREVAAISEQPVIAGRNGGVDYYLSQRNSPALFGLGVLDSISADRLRALAKRQATRTKGEITGRFVGKFGWRGQVQSLAEFVNGACVGELGLNQGSGALGSTQASDPADPNYVNFGPDMTSLELLTLTSFVAAIPRPVERLDRHTRGDVLDGEKIFNSVGCVTCHVADIHPVSGMFTDLLLHDMGSNLQAPSPAPIGDLVGVSMKPSPRFSSQARRRSAVGAAYYSGLNATFPAPYPVAEPDEPRFPRGDLPESVHDRASGFGLTWDTLQREWRTPPLWGIADTAPYLHDGRAETLAEAIMWHGGEAESSRKRYSELSLADKDRVLAFLSSLRAPEFGDGKK